jgi:O-antigen ligase
MNKTLLSINRSLIYLAVFLVPFYFFRYSFGPIKTNIFELSVLLAFLFFLFVRLLTRRRPDFGSIRPYLFLAVAFISIFFASDKIAALGIFKGWFLVPVVLYFVIINVFESKQIPKLSIPLYFSLTIVSIWGLLQSFMIVGTLFYQRGSGEFAQYLLPDALRIFGPFESPNYLAMYLVPMIFLSLPIQAYIQKLPRPIYLLALAPFGIATYNVLMTGSRAGIIALVVSLVGLFVYQTFSVSNKKQQIAKVVIISLLIIFATAFFLNQSFTGRADSNSSRMDIYKYSVRLLKLDPITGIGLGSYKEKITALTANDINFKRNTLPYALHPHNVFLAVWLNIGLIGLILFALILVRFFTTVFKKRNPIKGLLFAAMLAILLHGLFDTTYFKNDLSAIFWIILALASFV